mmetsp:Transcript_5670/g.23320  ORF Transcript_5670/g.23320 Transcript_5670/m.23320 type:complete len:212 (+) Transcript_5670:167-802(+)
MLVQKVGEIVNLAIHRHPAALLRLVPRQLVSGDVPPGRPRGCRRRRRRPAAGVDGGRTAGHGHVAADDATENRALGQRVSAQPVPPVHPADQLPSRVQPRDDRPVAPRAHDAPEVIHPDASHGVVHHGGDASGVELTRRYQEGRVVEERLVRLRVGSAGFGDGVVLFERVQHSRRGVLASRVLGVLASRHVLGAQLVVEPRRQVLDGVELA